MRMKIEFRSLKIIFNGNDRMFMVLMEFLVVSVVVMEWGKVCLWTKLQKIQK